MTRNSDSEFVSDTTCLDNYGKGWKVVLASFGTLLLVTLVYALLRVPVDLAENFRHAAATVPQWLGLFSLLYAIFAVGPLTMGFGWVFLQAARGEEVHMRDLFAAFERNYWHAVGAGILVFFGIMLGFLLLIVPGIILTCRLAFVGFLIVDRRMDTMQAIRTSWAMTRGRGWSIFCMLLLAMLAVIAGLIALVVGVFVSIMWITAAFGVLYHSVSLKEGIPGPSRDAPTEMEA